MREIKFRAWHKKEKFMHTVAELHWCQGGIRFYGPGVGEGNFGEFELMQYTGLKDLKDREIYEGDIVKTEKKYIGKIIYCAPDTASFRVVGEKFGCPIVEEVELEIIGNIYENSELINKEKTNV